MLPDKKIQEIPESNGILATEVILEREKEAEAKNIPLEQLLLEQGIVDEAILYNGVATHYNLPFVNLREKTIDKNVLYLIPESLATTYQAIAFEKTPDSLSIAVTDPDDVQTIEFIRRKVNTAIAIHIATPSSIRDTTKLYHQSLETELADIQDKTGARLGTAAPESPKGDGDGKKLETLAKDLPVIRVVDTLLEYAIFEGASDIHIEPSEKGVLVRYRIDGVLRDVMDLPRGLKEGITARIKILSNLKLDEHRLPQDGRFKIENKDYRTSFRVSIIPVFDGEKVVIRLLDEGKKILSLEQLGLQQHALKAVQENLHRPNGMFLVTGPTGSGKTTTLYTMMDILNTPEVNISTVEDPIEYRMPRINQSQVNPKINFTFANGLRSLLRQDPNIIMVGEIRDRETAGIAINAAMTGHLVLSTLHTNDAPTALPRLLDMGIEPFLVASTVNLILAQRLVRKICKHCIASYQLKPEEVTQLQEDFHIDIPALEKKLLGTEGAAAEKQTLGSMLFFKGKGCTKCGNKGYKGRIGIYEALTMSEAIKTMVTTHENADQIGAKAREEGMLTMLEDGFLKAKAGMTTIEEVLRVTSV